MKATRTLAEMVAAKAATEAAAAAERVANARARYWTHAIAAASGAPARAADADNLIATLADLGVDLDAFERDVAALRSLDTMRRAPTVEDARRAAQAVREQCAALDAQAAALRAQADQLEAESRRLGHNARSPIDEARARERKLAALASELRSAGCPEVDGMPPPVVEVTVRRVKTDCECRVPGGRLVPPSSIFEWVGDGALPQHLVEVDEHGRPINVEPEQAAEQPASEQAPMPEIASPTLPPSFFSIEGGK